MLLVATITSEGGIHLNSADTARTGLAFEILRPVLHEAVPALAQLPNDQRLSAAAKFIEGANLRAVAAAGFTEIAVAVSLVGPEIEIVETRHGNTIRYDKLVVDAGE